ncbi:hypothetical protein SAMN05428975_5628 [Mucilaginibacter sp. OK268]|nr:hypothetical protein SAMN05428975_5628 [Mucilaginibacter sp. OK268]
MAESEFTEFKDSQNIKSHSVNSDSDNLEIISYI